MRRGDTTSGIAGPKDDGLESYRRLIKLQKQMVEMSQQHQISKRQRDSLREQVAREAASLARRRESLGHRLRRSTARFITRLPGFALIAVALKAANPKQF